MKNKTYAFIDESPEETVIGYADDRLRELKHLGKEYRKYNIYLGRIENYVPSIDAWFVDLDGKKTGFLKNPLRKRKAGEELFVQIIKENEGKKRDRVIDNIFLHRGDYDYYPLSGYYKKNRKDIDKKDVPGTIRKEMRRRSEALKKEMNFLPIPRLVVPAKMEVIDLLDRKPETVMTNKKELKHWGPNIVFDESYDYRYDERISEDLHSLSSNRVPLPGGGEIVIDRAEALTAVDINSKQDGDDPFLINKKALKEVFYQMELRDIKGIIICDMINMEERLFPRLEAFIEDGIEDTSLEYHGMTRLQLLEFTRS